jgi:carboxylesterase type B
MDWIGKYIALFGGDSEQVTVMGLSAGAGVILHQLVSNGGDGPKLPFQQVSLTAITYHPI